MRAKQIGRCEAVTLRSKRVKIQGIVQEFQHELTVELDVQINGICLRLPVGCIVSITAGGSGGALGSLTHDLEFTGADGQEWKVQRGMQFVAPGATGAGWKT